VIRSLIFASVLLTVACGSGTSSAALTQADNGRTIELRIGDELVVSLEGNPTTGFDWELVAPVTPELAQIERTFTPQSTLIGAGGTVRYRFRAAAPGTAALRLAYRRSFESVPPLRSFGVDLTVRP
jgi:inhibitor of cysteine peptidase